MAVTTVLLLRGRDDEVDEEEQHDLEEAVDDEAGEKRRGRGEEGEDGEEERERTGGKSARVEDDAETGVDHVDAADDAEYTRGDASGERQTAPGACTPRQKRRKATFATRPVSTRDAPTPQAWDTPICRRRRPRRGTKT